jgi:hypothetical protein
MNGLHNQFAGFDLPEEMKQMYRLGHQPFGPKNIAKLAIFLQENKIENFNEVYDYYVSLKPQRLENESDAEFKNRSSFTKALQKNKQYFYNYSVYENQ